MISIDLEKLNNTRDLGGISVAGGHVVPGKLIRSGHLGAASESDIRWISDNVDTVIDFRSDKERCEAPDPQIDGVENLHMPVIKDLAAGITRDEESDKEAFKRVALDPSAALRYMCGLYEEFVLLESARTGYEAFIRELFADPDRTVLWHCTAGKDRAGFATALVLEMLGADRETIIADYLATNVFLESEVQNLVAFYAGSVEALDPALEQSFRYLFGASREFLEAAYAKAEELYGSMAGFIRDGLHIEDADIEAWRQALVTDK